MIRVLLSVQHRALEVELRTILSADPEIMILGDHDDAADVDILTSAAYLRYVSRSRGALREPRGTLVLGADERDQEQLWKQSAAWGVLPTDAGPEEMRAAVRAVAAGLVVGAPGLLKNPAGVDQDHGTLTQREIQVLGLLSAGMANKQAAAQLGISEHTVKFHVSSIYSKLNVSNRAEAVREGLRGGWIAL